MVGKSDIVFTFIHTIFVGYICLIYGERTS